ncbi:nitroreductase family protein [Oscillibacter sp. PC13]
MEFKEVIKNRYACKKFDGPPVDKAQLNIILKAGCLAPTAKNCQE